MNTKKFSFTVSDLTILKELSENITSTLANNGWVIVDTDTINTANGVVEYVIRAYHREAAA